MLGWIKSIFQKEIKETGHVFYPMLWKRNTDQNPVAPYWGWGAFSQKLTRGDSIILSMQSGKKARFLVHAVKNVETPSGSDHFGEIYQDVKVQPIEYL